MSQPPKAPPQDPHLAPPRRPDFADRYYDLLDAVLHVADRAERRTTEATRDALHALVDRALFGARSRPAREPANDIDR